MAISFSSPFTQKPWQTSRGWTALRVSHIAQNTHDTKTLWLTNDQGGRPFDFWPGQYLTFRLDGLENKPVIRSYSLSSSPKDDRGVSLTVKAIPGGKVSQFLSLLSLGTVLQARGPMGGFVHKPSDGSPLVMIAAGSGIAPFLSMIQAYGDESWELPMFLFVSYRSKEDQIGLELLKPWIQRQRLFAHITLSQSEILPNSIFPHLIYGMGRYSSDILAKLLPNFDKAHYMACGPRGLMETVRQALTLMGRDPSKLHVESYS